MSTTGVYEFRMPSLGADMEAGTLMKWLVAPGDRVERGDVVAVVDTEKADIEVEVFASGVVEELLVEPGKTVPVGTLLARLRTEEEAGKPAAAEAALPAAAATRPIAAPAPGPPAAVPAAPPSPAAPPATVPAAPPSRPAASPAALRRARELGLALATLPATGPGGAVTLADVERAAAGAVPAAAVPAAAPAAAPPAVRGARRALAAAMERSNREIPHYHLATEVDLTRALAWLAEANLERPVTERLLPAALLLKAVAVAAGETPEMNGSWVEGAFRPAAAVHLGVVVSRRAGEVVVPAIQDAGGKTVTELMAALRDLVARARAGSLRSSEVATATLTVSNLGDFGADAVYGVIYPPQVALVGFGRIAERPRVEAGAVVARPTVIATLAADHRASDGARGARFLARIAALLEKPEAL